jgi:uncharacterized protein (TIGR02001 family)
LPTRCHRLPITAALAITALAVACLPAGAQQFDTTNAAPIPTKASAAKAQTDSGASFDAKFNAALTSDYNYRGYTLSNHLPSVSSNVEVDYSILFASVNGASVQFPGLSHFQMTDTLGLRPVFDKLTVESGVGYYSYPGSVVEESYAELYLSPSYVLDKLTLGVNFYYAPNYYRTGAWENYNSITGKYDLGSGWQLSGELGRQGFGTTTPRATSPPVKLPDYVYGNIGVTYTYKSLAFDVHLNATTLSKQSCFLITGTGSASGGSNGCNPAIIGTVTWSSTVSEIKAAPGEKKEK